jgi:hypothetical protein
VRSIAADSPTVIRLPGLSIAWGAKPAIMARPLPTNSRLVLPQSVLALVRGPPSRKPRAKGRVLRVTNRAAQVLTDNC